MERLLKVLSITKGHSDKVNSDYKVVELVEAAFTAQGREIKAFNKRLSGTRVIWPTHKVMVDGVEVTIKADPNYDNIFVDDIAEGEVQNFNTTPYTIGGKRVTTYKAVIFRGENGLAVAAKNLAKENAAPFDPETSLPFKLGAAATQSAPKGETLVEEPATV